ncbi:MAG TPA: hypothetical protein VGF26_16790, partial [Ramlibacter sp.]
ELHTGTPPFAGSKALISARSRRGELPLALDAVYARALAARPESRYRSAAEFSDALQAAVPGPHWDRSVPAASPVRVELPAETPAPDTGRAVVPPTQPEPPVRAARRRWFGPAIASGAALAVLALALWTGIEQVPAASTADTKAVAAAPEEPVITGAQPAPALVTEPLESEHAAQEEQKTAAAAPRPHAREGRPDARRTARSHRATGVQVVQVVHSLPPSPETACRQDFAIAREACTAFRCATSEFRQHPVCVRMHAEGARARAQLAESRGGP